MIGVFAPKVLADDWYYDGTDPHATGCDSSAYTAYSRNVQGGLLELRFSSSCQTAWARFTCNDGNGCTNYTLWAHRVQDAKEEVQHVTWPNYTDYGTTLYTAQLYDDYRYQVYACKQNYFGGATECTSAFLPVG